MDAFQDHDRVVGMQRCPGIGAAGEFSSKIVRYDHHVHSVESRCRSTFLVPGAGFRDDILIGGREIRMAVQRRHPGVGGGEIVVVFP